MIKGGVLTMQDVVRILTPVAIFFAGTLYLALMRDILEEPSETNITVEELIRREYGEWAFFDDKTFISDGKLYRYKYDKDGQLHVFYVEDVTDKVITWRGCSNNGECWNDDDDSSHFFCFHFIYYLYNGDYERAYEKAEWNKYDCIYMLFNINVNACNYVGGLCKMH